MAGKPFFQVDALGVMQGILSDYVEPLDIIRELVSNSLDHGKASQIEIKFRVETFKGQPGLTVIFKERASGMNEFHQDRWSKEVSMRRYEGKVEIHKGRGTKGILNSSYVEIETVYKDDKTNKNKKWHIKFDDPHSDLRVKHKLPEPIIITDNEFIDQKATFLKYTIKNLNPEAAFWEDIRPDKARAYLIYRTKAIDKRLLFNDCQGKGKPNHPKGPKLSLDFSGIVHNYESVRERYGLDKIAKCTIKPEFKFPKDYHSQSYPKDDDITAPDEKMGCVKLSRVIRPKHILLKNALNQPIGDLFITAHVAGQAVQRAYLVKAGNAPKKPYMGLYLMKNGVPVKYDQTAGGTKVLDTDYQRFQIFAECPQLEAVEGRGEYVKNDVWKKCIEAIGIEYKIWKGTDWYKALSRGYSRLTKGGAKPPQPPPPQLPPPEGGEPLPPLPPGGDIAPPTDEWEMADLVHKGKWIKKQIKEGQLKEADKKIADFYPYEPHLERILEALLYRLSCESEKFPYTIDLLQQRFQDIVATERDTGNPVVGEAKLHLKDILSKTRNHQPETLDFVVVWHEDILDSKSSNYDPKWVYDKTTKIIRNPNTNKEVKVIVLPEHIFRYLKSKKNK